MVDNIQINGFLPIDRVIVKKFAENKYVVLEGNRRICAAKNIMELYKGIIGLHNHPSGNVKPSKEDMIVTRKLQKCGQLLGIELLDHIIVGGTNGKMLSFREEKMLNVTGRMGEMER